MKVSVCMATYNGSKYIQTQIISILSQLQTNDELIIVDDFSQDNTVEIINDFNDFRIKLIKNVKNIGVVKSFEKSIARAKGELIFLSDQDDIWLPHKVDTIKRAFELNLATTLVLSDAEVINHKGNIICQSFFLQRGRFKSGVLSNIIKNKYHGCTMAFKRKILDYILPFPDDIPMHDMWIGIVNDIHGNTKYIDEPLMQYRRHNQNVTLSKNASVIKMLHWRFFLLKNLFGPIWKQFINFSI